MILLNFPTFNTVLFLLVGKKGGIVTCNKSGQQAEWEMTDILF